VPLGLVSLSVVLGPSQNAQILMMRELRLTSN
jgi:hypothetical protein